MSGLTGALQTSGFDFLWAFPLIVEQLIGCSGFHVNGNNFIS